MDENTIISYFLTIGASYRFSDKWNEKFTKNNESTIRRTGKFGIGILASFLIGDEIEISTRSINDDIGCVFNVSMRNNNSNVNLMRENRVDFGTTIKIKISYEKLKYFKIDYVKRIFFLKDNPWYNWYFFKKPQINYYFNKKPLSESIIYIPNINESNSNWYNLNSNKYASYNWTYKNPNNIFNFDYHNGMPIGRHSYSFDEYGMDILLPTISIIDKNNLLNIDLSRNTILEIPEQELLINEIYKYFIAKLLTMNWSDQFKIASQISSGFSCICSCVSTSEILHSSFMFFENCYSVFLYPFLSMDMLNNLYMIYCKTNIFNYDNLFNTNQVTCYLTDSLRNLNDFLKEIFIFSQRSGKSYSCDINFNSLWFNKTTQNHLEEHLIYNLLDDKNILKHKPKGTGKNADEFINYSFSKNSTNTINIKDINLNIISFISHFTINVENKSRNNIMIQTIKEYLGDDIWIPIDMEKRKKKFPKAFKELSKYMDLND